VSIEFIREFTFWGIWLVIPLLIDVLSGISGAMFVLIKYFKKKPVELDYMPYVNILIPIYNSSNTLKGCLDSIKLQNYPIKNITVFLIDNGTRDKSYDIYCDFQRDNPTLKIWWLDSTRGKAKALNKGLYMAEGKYIINIDSDGILDKNAVLRVVEKFEGDMDIYAMTGVVLIDSNYIEKTKSYIMRLIQTCEFFEYTEAFLVGRGFQSASNTMFTLAGAFSCYRKDIVLKTQLYNNETLGEDTHMTSQIRGLNKGKIVLCEDAYFYVDPVENLDKLYIQRQRWQRGQVEVSSLFRNGSGSDKGSVNKRKKKLFSVLNLTILKDHTLVFPRFIWIFAMLYLVFLDYPLGLIIGANVFMYLAYVLSSLLYYFVAKVYLKDMKRDREYMDKHLYTIFLLPIYRFMVFMMRVAGIINSAQRYASWNTKTFTEEKSIVGNKLREHFKVFFMVKEWMNNG
jgi:poly-beta-1,6-N-acetyl-D-glucosamine synthase